MIGPPAGVRVLMATRPVDFRKGADSLAALVQTQLGHEPFVIAKIERSRALAEFVAHMTKLNRGRAFYASPERLGEYVLVDFVGRRTKHVA